MELTLLGTSCSIPTKERNVPGYFLSYKNEGILFDCGEGTQRQMNICGIKRTSVTKILITHWHGDHVSGLIGLLQTVSNELGEKIKIWGPKGTKKRMKSLMETCFYDQNLNIEVNELTPKGIEKFYENEDYILECAKMNHSTEIIAYSFVEKNKLRIDKDKIKKLGLKEGSYMKDLTEGKNVKVNNKKINYAEVTYLQEGRKLTYITDTRPNKNCIELAEQADLLLCEGVYTHDLLEKGEKYYHMTAREAGLIASQANVKKLVLIHFSQRYKNVLELQEDAQTVFDNVICGEDFMKIRIER